MPRGVTLPAFADCSASSRSASSCTQRSWNARPLSVSDSRRVVRFSRRVARCASSSATWRETADTDTPRRSAARAKLPASTTRVKAPIAWKRSMMPTIIAFIATVCHPLASLSRLDQGSTFVRVAPPGASPRGIHHERLDPHRPRRRPAAHRPGRHVHRPRAAQVLRLHAARHRAVLRIAGAARRARLRHLRRGTDRRRDARPRRVHPRRRPGAGPGAAGRDLGARRQRLDVQRAQGRLGVPCVPDARCGGGRPARRRPLLGRRALRSATRAPAGNSNAPPDRSGDDAENPDRARVGHSPHSTEDRP